MQAGQATMAKRVDFLKQNLVKYIISWVGEAVAYWIFVIIMLDSAWGFNWWMAEPKGRFGIICIVYAVKNFGILVLTPIMWKRQNSILGGEVKFPWVDILYFITQLVFWIVSAIYAWDRYATAEKIKDADWVKRQQKWIDEAYILPVVKLCVDFVYSILASILHPLSHTALSGGGIIWMDLQYLFVYLFITGKVVWDNYFIVFVWIYMNSIVATMFSLCILCFVCVSMFKSQGLNVVQYVMYIAIAVMIILFFIWATIIGSKDYTNSNNYIALVVVILFTLFNGIQTFALWRGIDIVPQQR